MSTIRKIWRDIIWESTKEDTGNYFVTYHPLNFKRINFASLDLTFTDSTDPEAIASAMEKELDLWITKYPLPLVVSAYDKKGDAISLGNVRENNSLVGYFENKKVTTSWSSHLPFTVISDLEIQQVYKNLRYKTVEEKEQEAKKSIKENRSIKRFVEVAFFFWMAVSVIIVYLGWQSHLVGMAAFIYALYKTIKQGLKWLGFKTKRDLEESEKKRKMSHYYYHCELNPIGFKRLVVENFDQMAADAILAEKEEIRH